MGVIIFNGNSSLDYGIQVEQPPEYQTPAKDYDIIHVPGKNGDVVIDKGSYKNVSRNYKISSGYLDSEFTPLANRISEWLHSASGYARLEDSYEPEYYRLAMYDEAGMIENLLGQAGRATISFNCKPQRFLKAGDDIFLCSSASILLNPTGFDSLPIVKINFTGKGGGVISIGGYTAVISNGVTTSMTINSEIQDVYDNTTNLNSKINLIKGFPKLTPGENEISFSGNIASVEVIPKWWTL